MKLKQSASLIHLSNIAIKNWTITIAIVPPINDPESVPPVKRATISNNSNNPNIQPTENKSNGAKKIIYEGKVFVVRNGKVYDMYGHLCSDIPPSMIDNLWLPTVIWFTKKEMW